MQNDGTVLTPESLMDPSGAESVGISEYQTRESATEGVDSSSPEQSGHQLENQDPAIGKRISDTEAALNDRRRQLRELETQIHARKAVMEELAEARKQSQEPAAPDPFAFLSDDTVDDDWDSHPSKGIKDGLRRALQTIPELLVSRDKALKEEIQSMLREQLNPERMELRDTLKQLESKPWFAKLSPAEQIAAAKDLRANAGNTTETLDPTGSPYGNGRKAPQTRDPMADREKQLQALAAKMFGPPRDVTADVWPMGKPEGAK